MIMRQASAKLIGLGIFSNQQQGFSWQFGSYCTVLCLKGKFFNDPIHSICDSLLQIGHVYDIIILFNTLQYTVL